MLLAGIANYKEFLIYVGGYKQEAVLNEYENLQKSVNSYIVIKTLISIATGLLTFIFAEIFGIQFSLFWGFIAFIFNFIPNIGSIAGVLLPVTMSVIQLDSFHQILTFSVLLIVMQFIMGNFIEPIIMGNRLRLNTPTVLIGLVFWGYIWGIPGMILSVPLLVIIKIILEKYPEYSMIARLMGYPDKK
jgi:predicted PurR-regulated permease PerM